MGPSSLGTSIWTPDSSTQGVGGPFTDLPERQNLSQQFGGKEAHWTRMTGQNRWLGPNIKLYNTYDGLMGGTIREQHLGMISNLECWYICSYSFGDMNRTKTVFNFATFIIFRSKYIKTCLFIEGLVFIHISFRILNFIVCRDFLK